MLESTPGKDRRVNNLDLMKTSFDVHEYRYVNDVAKYYGIGSAQLAVSHIIARPCLEQGC